MVIYFLCLPSLTSVVDRSGIFHLNERDLARSLMLFADKKEKVSCELAADKKKEVSCELANDLVLDCSAAFKYHSLLLMKPIIGIRKKRVYWFPLMMN